MRKLSLAGLILIVSWPALAQHGDWCACGKHSTEPAFFEIDHTTAVWQTEAATSFARWNTYSDVFGWAIGDGFAGTNGINEVVFFDVATTLDIYGFVIDSGSFGVTYINPDGAFGNPSFNACPPPPNTSCGSYTKTDIIMNADLARGWTTAAPNFNDTGPALYIATAIHEMGHALGAHHNFDSLTTMNYYEDYAALYLSRSDAGLARGHHDDQAQTVTDIATYPFRFFGYQYGGTTVASATPSVVQQGQQLTLRNVTIENVGSESLSNVQLRVYLSSDASISSSDHLLGTVSFSSFSAWWDTTATNFTVPASVPAGTYYVGAIIYHDTDQTDAVSYNNSWGLDITRRVTVTTPPCSPDAFEPDSNSGQAMTITSGVPKNHSICPTGDDDWSTFTLTKASAVTLETSGPAGDTRMWLRDSGATQIEFDDDDGAGLFSLIDRACGVDELPAGSYFVEVDEFGDNAPIASYDLSLTAIPCPPPAPANPTPSDDATAVPFADVTLSWDAVAEADSYDLYLNDLNNPPAFVANIVAPTFNMGSLAPSTTYQWVVIAKNTGGDSNLDSATWMFTTVAPGMCPADLTLADQTLSGTQTLQATTTTTLGPNLIINGASIVINAPTVTILGDTSIGGTFSVGNQPSCP